MQMLDYPKDYDPQKHPEWIGKRHELSQIIEETQGEKWAVAFV